MPNKKRPQPKLPDHIFRPRLDWWVAAIAIFVMALCTVSLPYIIWYGSLSIGVTLLFIGFLIGFILYLVDSVFYTYYMLDEAGLMIVSKFRLSVIPYPNIQSVQAKGVLSLFSIWGRKRYALSRRALELRLTDYHWRYISISPFERDRFLSLLLDKMEHFG